MQYQLYFEKPARQLIRVVCSFVAGSEQPTLHLPKWRPGRYELQRFDKLIADVIANVPIRRTATHTWELQAEVGQKVTVSYHFYANQRDSGGSVFDANGIYINPCNLLLYQTETLASPCSMQLHLPAGYQLACGLSQEGNTVFADNYHDLADAPLFAAPDLLHHAFEVMDLKVHLWFWGECKPDLARLEKDISAYTETQIRLFGDCPVKAYHYLLQILPNTFRHGVEHQGSSVNTFGPGIRLMETPYYQSFIELLSHEFFHTWNVKYLRPADMYPYTYHEENYSELHYVTEGVTSYYGDLMLLKAGVYDVPRFLHNLNVELADHYRMPGKDHVSLSQASFNSWINGYGADTGIPNRKISFYTKGYIVAFMLDMLIRRESQNAHSLDEVLRSMYQQIAKNGRGYTKEDYKHLCEQLAGKNLDDFFAKYIDGTEPLDKELKSALKHLGMTFSQTMLSLTEQKWGFRLSESRVENVLPDSPAERAGIAKGDELVALNGQKFSGEEMFRFWANETELDLHFFHFHRLYQAKMVAGTEPLMLIPLVEFSPFPIEEAEENREKWVSLT